ncbi:AP-3 complex subunit beta [Perkinsus chesapeaki]|uniref:AP-3 complex subunit beta n=1 Tax=Perkinsus chesapeaki TaxID=330153 RepID=A0A7J6MXM3_PERCH|nr:AP-3 complex subunit beta [Perkinsus chesapeaki]
MYSGGAAGAASVVNGVKSVISNLQHVSSGASFSESKYFNGSINLSQGEIRRGLNSPSTEAKLDAMRRLLAAEASSGNPNICIDLFSEVVKNMSISNLELKRLVYAWIVSHAEARRELALLSVNTFQKDSVDARSALVRAASLRSMAAIRVLEMIQVVMAAVNQAAVDSSVYVRKSVAAVCLPQVFTTDIDQFPLVRSLLLKMMTSDGSELVVGAAVMSYFVVCVQLYGLPRDQQEVHSDDALRTDRIKESLSMIHSAYPRLVKLLPLMEPFGQYYTIELLHRYCRLHFNNNREEVVHQHCGVFLEVLASHLLLSHSRFVVHLACCVLWDLDQKHYAQVVSQQLISALVLARGSEATETLIKTVLELVRHGDGGALLFRPHLRKFFLMSYDSPLVAELKLAVIRELVDESNVHDVLGELQVYVRWQNRPGLTGFLAKVVALVSHIARQYPVTSDRVMGGLISMLDSACPILANEAVVAVREIIEHRQRSGNSKDVEAVLVGLSRALESLTAPAARASVVWLLAQRDGLSACAYTVADTFRSLVKGWDGEQEMVQLQVMVLGIRLWAFHQLNSLRKEDRQKEPLTAEALMAEEFPGVISRRRPLNRPILFFCVAAELLPRLSAIVDHMLGIALRDPGHPRLKSAATIMKMMKDAYGGMCTGGWEKVSLVPNHAGPRVGQVMAANAEVTCDLQRLARGYLHAHLPRWLTGRDTVMASAGRELTPSEPTQEATKVPLQSLSFVLETPLSSCEEILQFDQSRAAEGERQRQQAFNAMKGPSVAASSRSALRERVLEPVARSLSSGDAQRQRSLTSWKAAIPHKPAPPMVETLADLDLFYSDEPREAADVEEEEGEPSQGSSGEADEPWDSPKAAVPTVDLASLFRIQKDDLVNGRHPGQVVTGEDTESSDSDGSQDA